MKTSRNATVRVACLALLGAVVLSGAPAGAGYLALLGPPALRWHAAAPPNREKLAALPPLEPEASGETSASNAAPVVVLTNALNAELEHYQHSLTNELPADAPPRTPGVPYDPAGMISPQWLSELFYMPQRSNNVGTGVTVPLQFVPPSNPPRSSTATYSTGKP